MKNNRNHQVWVDGYELDILAKVVIHRGDAYES
jgi:hypothetical protein